MRRFLLLWWLAGAVALAAVPKPPKVVKKPPPPVLCQVVVHVVQAGTVLPVPGLGVTMLHARVVTDSDGRAVFKQVPNHPVTIEVHAEEVHAAEVVPNPKQAIEVTIPVHVFVDVVVQALAQGGDSGLPGVSVVIDDRPAGETDAAGRLTVRLMAGVHSVRLTHASYVFMPSVLSTRLEGTEDTSHLAFFGRPITGRIKIRVVERIADRVVPLPGASVQVRSPDSQVLTLSTGLDGTVVSDLLTLGTYGVTAQAPGVVFPPGPGTITLSAPGEVWLTLEGAPGAP